MVKEIDPVQEFSQAHWQIWGGVKSSDRFGFEIEGGDGPTFKAVNQVHGTKIVEAQQGVIEADGIYSQKPSEVIGIKTADCLPVLLRAPTLVMALHAGWRGLVAGIIPSAFELLREQNQRAEQVEVILGPCICPKHFEVGPEVVEQVLHACSPLAASTKWLCLTKGDRDRWFVDLAGLALLQLRQEGVSMDSVTIYRDCTFEENSCYPSYRREGSGCGRLVSWIKL